MRRRTAARDDVVAAIAARSLQLDHHPDAPAHQIERSLEGRVFAAGTRRLVRDDEPALGVGVHVDLDIVGADLDRALERGQRVLGQLGRGAAMGYDKHRRISSTSMRSTSSSASRSRSGSSVPSFAITRSPAAFADAMPASVSSKTSASFGSPSRRSVLQVALGVRLAAHDVVGRNDRSKVPGEAGRLDDRLDLRTRRAGADRERHALGGVAHRFANVLVDRGAVSDRCAVAVHPLGDHLVDVGMILAEPRPHDLRIGEARELGRSTPGPTAASHARRRGR